MNKNTLGPAGPIKPFSPFCPSRPGKPYLKQTEIIFSVYFQIFDKRTCIISFFARNSLFTSYSRWALFFSIFIIKPFNKCKQNKFNFIHPFTLVSFVALFASVVEIVSLLCKISYTSSTRQTRFSFVTLSSLYSYAWVTFFSFRT